ncbi:MAG: alanine racemase [Treponema sp.]|nr:alanine racemase [Treponema sp.]
MRATRAIIHIDTFLENFRVVQELIGPERVICVPVKADAYGHGAAAIARASLDAGAAFLGVADVQEGAALRNEGIDAPILLFSQPLPAEIPEIITNRVCPFVSDGEFISLLGQAAEKAHIRLPVHLKIDSGMSRLGCTPEEAPTLAQQIAACTALEYAGTATHLASADSAAPDDRSYTEQQIANFSKALDAIRAEGLHTGIIHAANSGAVLLHPAALFDMVRPGILLYGYIASEARPAALPLRIKPVMELRTNVVLIKQIKQGTAVSYGRTWTASHDTEIAVLPVGYADGLPRIAGNRWQVLINGTSYPLTGRVCMDHCMVELGFASGVRRWDETVIFGGPAPDAAALAELAGTIPYEITCNVNKRVPRVFVTS